MKAIGRLSVLIAANLISLASYSSADSPVNKENPFQKQQFVTLSVKSSFDHGDGNNMFSSVWSGDLFCLYGNHGNGSLEVAFPVGFGEKPSELSTNLIVKTKNGKTLSSGPVYLSFTDYKADPDEVAVWTQIKKIKNPSLVMTLGVSEKKGKTYTNEEEIKARIVAWIRNGTKLICLPYAGILIPERSVEFNYSTDRQGKQTVMLNIKGMQIMDIDEDTWKLICENGNRHLGLPSDPEDGVSGSFVARTESIEKKKIQTAEKYRKILFQAYVEGDVDPDSMKKINGYLDAFFTAKKREERVIAANGVLLYSGFIEHLGRNGNVTAKDSQKAFDLNRETFKQAHSSSRFPGRRTPWSSSDPAGPEVSYVVRQTIHDYTPDGTNLKPFWSISQAYDAAKATDSRQVELIVDGGYYDESLNLDRNTILTASAGSIPVISGTITCTRAIHLQVTGFSLVGAPSPGAIQVLVPGSSVVLTGVEIRDANRYGIFQRGGEIELRNVTINGTKSEPGKLEYGAGLVLRDRAQAFLSTVALNENGSSGIILNSAGTYMFGTSLVLVGNKIHPDFYASVVNIPDFPSGAFLIYDHAEANLTDVTLSDNEFVGLSVHGSATAGIDNAFINFNRSIRLPDSAGVLRSYGGIGIRARDGGRITMQNFAITRCDLLGISVLPLGEIDLQIGEVSHNIIGAYTSAGFNEARLIDRVLFFGNERNLDTEMLPTPDGAPDIPE